MTRPLLAAWPISPTTRWCEVSRTGIPSTATIGSENNRVKGRKTKAVNVIMRSSWCPKVCPTFNPALGSAKLPLFDPKNERAPSYLMSLGQHNFLTNECCIRISAHTISLIKLPLKLPLLGPIPAFLPLSSRFRAQTPAFLPLNIAWAGK